MYCMPFKYGLVKGSKFAAGLLLGFFTVKNRALKPLREGRLALIFDSSRGIDPLFSQLETLIFLKFADVSKTTGEIIFRFNRWGVSHTTFDADGAEAGSALEEENDRGGRRDEPSITNRAEWPAFYAAHKADMDTLFNKAIEYTFATEGISDLIPNKDDDEDDELESEI
jgi:hypothetical protein